MNALLHLFALTAPLFLLVLVGYVLVRHAKWDNSVGDALTRFVFSVAVPALLFRLMSGISRMPPVDARLLAAYFGGALIVFLLGRYASRRLFGLDGVGQSVFAMGGIYGNTLMLGLPLAKTLIGEAALPTVSLLLVFNSFLLWTLATVSVEWARNRSTSLRGIGKTAVGVLRNPIVASILAGTAYGLVGLPIPSMVDRTLELIGEAAVPLSLIALGMGLARYGIRSGARVSLGIAVFKLAVNPLLVMAFAVALRLPPVETQAVVLLAAVPAAANVYLMARQFGSLEGAVAGSLVLSTALGALTVPVMVAATVEIVAWMR
jgi:predicted permease